MLSKLIHLARRNPTATLSWGLIVAIVLTAVYLFQVTERQQKVAYCSENKTDKECKQYLPEIYKQEQEQKRLEISAIEQRKVELQEWLTGAGAESSCEEALKLKLRDPDSYERDGEFVRDTPADGNGKTIMWKFRAKNGFGGYNVSIGMCKATVENGGSVQASVVGDN
ncbi:MAG: hypothetical protein ACO3B3_09885 [Cyanobium sp.]